MYPSHLLTTLSLLTLPLTILAAPAPQLEPSEGPPKFYVTSSKSTLRGGRVVSSETSGHWVRKDFSFFVEGHGYDAATFHCTGSLTWEGTAEGNDEALAKPQTAQLDCSDPQVLVDVTTEAGEGAAETYGVKDREFPRVARTKKPRCQKNTRADTTECTSQGP